MATKTTKVFVGNLSFKTNPEELKNSFETVGKVANANIITRGTRSLGYGFVEFNSEEDANKAVSEMNKKKLDDREINVEIAKPRDETKTAPAGNRRPYFRGGRRGRGGYGGRGRFNNRGFRGRGFRGRTVGRPFTRRPAPSTESRGQSTTTLFVANLPFSLDDRGLAEVFSGLSVKNSHVVRRPNGRSKGFGFVEFNSEEDQKKGLAFEKKNVDGRDLVIKVAFPRAETDTTTTTTKSSGGTPTASNNNTGAKKKAT